ELAGAVRADQSGRRSRLARPSAASPQAGGPLAGAVRVRRSAVPRLCRDGRRAGARRCRPRPGRVSGDPGAGRLQHPRASRPVHERCGAGDRLDPLSRIRPVRRPVDRARRRREGGQPLGPAARPAADLPRGSARPALVAPTARGTRAPSRPIARM
ncbi:MAG: FIG00636845: hypothetical protein, partial [uncultured Sphingomonas sp.]